MASSLQIASRAAEATTAALNPVATIASVDAFMQEAIIKKAFTVARGPLATLLAAIASVAGILTDLSESATALLICPAASKLGDPASSLAIFTAATFDLSVIALATIS